MKVKESHIPGVLFIEPQVFKDERGFFLETFHSEKYKKWGIPTAFIQDNHSKSTQGTLRGLHLQRTKGQGKLIRAIDGRIFDVAVDVRVGSPTFKKWVSGILTADNFTQMYIPPGFAHGFCVLSETAQVEYKCTELYAPEDELTLPWDDPDLAIDWPLQHPTLSRKDRLAKPVKEVMGLLPQYDAVHL